MANVSYDQMIGETHGLAINYQFDIGGGTLQTHGISFAYAPAIRLFKNKLVISPAVELGWRSNFIDWSNLTYGEMIDPRYGFVSSQNTQAPNSQVHMFDMNAGILLSHHDFVYGAAFSHLTQPNESFSGTSKLPIKYTAHISYFWNIHPSVQLSPAFIYLQQQDFRQFLPSLSIWMYGARIGTAYRANLNISDAIIFMAGYQGKGFKVGYSYDLTVSSLSNNTGGSHEISLGYVFNCKKKEFRKGVRQISF